VASVRPRTRLAPARPGSLGHGALGARRTVRGLGEGADRRDRRRARRL